MTLLLATLCYAFAGRLLGCLEGYASGFRCSLPILPSALFIFEPVFVLLSVGHGGGFEVLGLSLSSSSLVVMRSDPLRSASVGSAPRRLAPLKSAARLSDPMRAGRSQPRRAGGFLWGRPPYRHGFRAPPLGSQVHRRGLVGPSCVQVAARGGHRGVAQGGLESRWILAPLSRTWEAWACLVPWRRPPF
jgi:hypothetical protein